ncbi:MAG TPA: phospholipid carrier-dependent glycosyltransferase, partial [Candidatus Binataceae bacterium]
LYPALVFAAPLALESATMMTVFAILSVTCLFNLWYVLHTLNTVVFMDTRDGLAMAASAVNLVALTLAVYFGLTALEPGEDREPAVMPFLDRIRIFAATTASRSLPQSTIIEKEIAPPAWTRIDGLVLAAMIAAALVTRFRHLGYPAEIVFDEVHFVAQARQYLHAEWFLDPHPPLAKLVIAGGIWMFGDHPWSWRVGNATLGTVLVGVTYLLGRRVTGSRLAATLAAAFIVCDGLFLVDSRTAVIDIVYVTFAAIAYLLLFRFLQTPGLLERRRILPWLGLALGLCVGSKLYIPVITVLLVVGFLVYALAWKTKTLGRLLDRRVVAAVMLVGSVAFAAFIAVFLPHFILGWWGGMGDLFHYYLHEVPDYERAVAEATHPYSSPWWSWPLMLRPVAYWQNFPKTGPVATVWGGGNPLLWWGALTAITITAVQALERPSLSRSFLVLGYLGYLMMWIWIGRTLFIYHYMGSLYLGYLALAWLIAQCWEGNSELWEHLSLLMTMAPAFILGLGGWWGGAGLLAVFTGYAAMLIRTRHAGRYVAAVFVLAALVLFIYYWPVWVGISIDRSGYYARMWLEGEGLRSWI